MSNTEYSKIMKSIIATVIAALVISLGSIFANYTISKYQVQENKKAIEKKADKEYVIKEVKRGEEIAKEKELRYNEAIETIKDDIKNLKESTKDDINDLEGVVKEQTKLLWKINDKIK